MVLRRLGALAVGVLMFAAAAQAAPVFYTDEATYLAAITPDFEVNVGLDGSGNPFGGNAAVDGTDIFTIGNDVDFSSPDGADTTLVTTNGGHPELGPTGPGGAFWSGRLRFDFATDAMAIGFGLHAIQAFTVDLYRDGVLLSSTAVDTGSTFGFLGLVEAGGFDAMILSGNSFWSIDGGRNAAGLPASSTRMMGQKGGVVPEPVALSLLGLGLVATAIRRRRA